MTNLNPVQKTPAKVLSHTLDKSEPLQQKSVFITETSRPLYLYKAQQTLTANSASHEGRCPAALCGHQRYSHEFFLNFIGLDLPVSMTKEHEICFRCLVVTSFPTTSPRDLMSNFSFNGTW